MAKHSYPTDQHAASIEVASQLNAVAGSNQYSVVEEKPFHIAKYAIIHKSSDTRLELDEGAQAHRLYHGDRYVPAYTRVVAALKDMDTWNNQRERQYAIKPVGATFTINAVAIHKAVVEAAEVYEDHKKQCESIEAIKADNRERGLKAIEELAARWPNEASIPFPGNYRHKLPNGVTVEISLDSRTQRPVISYHLPIPNSGPADLAPAMEKLAALVF